MDKSGRMMMIIIIRRRIRIITLDELMIDQSIIWCK